MSYNITELTNELGAKLGIKNLETIAFLSSAITYAASIEKRTSSKEDNSKSESQIFTTVAKTIELANQKLENEEAKRDRTSSLYAISSILAVALEKPKAYADIKNKARAIKTINRAVKDISTNMTKTVSIVVCSSNNQRDLAFVASNIDGVMSSLQEKLQKSVVASDTQENMISIVNKYSDYTKELESSSKTLKTLVSKAFADGYGSREQLENYTRDIVDENLEDVKNKIKSAVSAEDIAKELKVPLKTYEFVIKSLSLKTKFLNAEKGEILKELAEGKEVAEILKRLNFHTSFLDENSFRTQINLWKKEQKTAKPTTQAAQKTTPAKVEIPVNGPVAKAETKSAAKDKTSKKEETAKSA